MIRLSLRFLIPLFVALSVVAYLSLPLVDSLTRDWFQRDLSTRSQVIAEALYSSLNQFARSGSRKALETDLNRITQDERLVAAALCSPEKTLLAGTTHLSTLITCAKFADEGQSRLFQLEKALLHISSVPVTNGEKSLGQLLLVHDMGFITLRNSETRRYIFYLFLVLGILIASVTVVIAQLSWQGWVSGIQAILRGEGLFKPSKNPPSPEMQPILKNLSSLVHDLESDRRVSNPNEISWTAKKLKEILQKDLAGEEVLILANREPYSHIRKGNAIEVQAPASGLVTALEPILRACSGTWIAHGSGNADRETVDRRNRVQVPPEDPSYTLRRVWLSEKQENGYYNGFANQAMWPLCHLAHARPIFRKSDWNYYKEVNQLFSNAVCEEAKTEDPVVLVQDYHFALAPKMIKERLPRATIITFWHIPWPNPEVFSICPWGEEILQGLLGSTAVGFHTRMHCHNFLDTVDRVLESRVDREHSTISYENDLTAVRSYPISIEWPPQWLKKAPPVAVCHKTIRERLSLPPDAAIGVGVDRLDYTKGILERLRAVDQLLELYPKWIGKFFFVQISAPSRSQIPSYHAFQTEVTDLYQEINAKYAKRGSEPIIFLPKHHEPEQLAEYYRGANLCFVSSLHDGMNLVAKEYIASREDEYGVLVLSTFTGAAQELPEAFLVNPYAIDQCAEALNASLEMSLTEQRERMRSMRSLIRERNIYRWAGGILLDAARMKKRDRLQSLVQDWNFLKPLPQT